jgi:replicative DNA helicase
MKAVANTPTGTIVGTPSGFRNIDRLVPGFLGGELIIIAARPGMGKTAFTLQLALQLTNHFPVGFFSLEMQAAELAKRMLAAESNVPLDAILRNQCTEEQRLKLRIGLEKMSGKQIIIDDQAAQRPLQILSKARKMKRQHKIGALVIDYLQLMNAYDEGRKFNTTDDAITYISGMLKRIAKDLDIPVFALSQLNREVEKRGGDKRPMLSDLRSSGSIEQDADKVIFIYRPEYYGIKTEEVGTDTKGTTEIIIAKQRNGPLDTAILHFEGKYQKFSDR